MHRFLSMNPFRLVPISLRNISNTRHSRFITYQTSRRKLKIRRVAEYFWRTSRFLILCWNTVTSVWYNFSNKLILKEKLRVQKRRVFHQTRHGAWFPLSLARKRVSSDIQTLRSRLKKRGVAEFFLNDYEVFGYLMKHTFECSIWLLKWAVILEEIQG